MKKILLIGDSIRMGYDHYVQESMKDKAEVYFPSENCMYTTRILRNLHVWTDRLKLYEADAVHFNAGLWDTLRIYGDGLLIRPEEYADNLVRIVKRIRFLFPEAKIIFATSTPVIESGFIPDFEMRYNCDIEAYNTIAREALAGHDVIINDLYATLRDVPENYHSDQTHFYTASATELIGGQVCRVLCEALDIDFSELSFPDAAKYHHPELYLGDKNVYEQKGNIYVERK